MPRSCMHSTTAHAGRFINDDLIFAVEYEGACYDIRLVRVVSSHIATIHNMQCEPRERFWDCSPDALEMMHEISFFTNNTAQLYVRTMPTFSSAIVLGGALIGLAFFLGTSNIISSAPNEAIHLPIYYAVIIRDFSAVFSSSLMYSLLTLDSAVFPSGSMESFNSIAVFAVFAVAAISGIMCMILLSKRSLELMWSLSPEHRDASTISLRAPYSIVVRLMYEVLCLLVIALLRPPQIADSFGLLLNFFVGITLAIVSARDAVFIFNMCDETRTGLSTLVLVYLGLVQAVAIHLIYPCCISTESIHPGLELIVSISFVVQASSVGARHALTSWC